VDEQELIINTNIIKLHYGLSFIFVSSVIGDDAELNNVT